MNKLMMLLAAGSLLMVACTSAPDADKANASDAVQPTATAGDSLKIDLNNSVVNWVGTKQTGKHEGTFKIADGVFTLERGNLKGGTFTIDVTSLNVTDLTGDEKGQLEGHLKSGDFFETEKFPTAKFEITSIAPYDAATATSKLEGATHVISGNLTLKGVTKNISFPAKVSMQDGTLSAQADFNIDRTEWEMNYKGPNNPADWFIKKEVNLKLDIKGGTM
ncbi:MAG TPA: YceI family protein [Phnomibacter sp.]|nr:YceI family protein [Phnomibacter sp.]